jgi:(R,R)-butanediol dehydrogenase/meso-butanediol dehydrogenase/diacetyl reductase
VAIDAAGKTAANEAVVASVRPGGTIGIPSVHPGPITFDVRRLTRNDLTVVGSVGYTRRAWDKTLELARAGLLPLESVVTARIELDEIATKGFDVLSVPSDELKILVRVGGEAATA